MDDLEKLRRLLDEPPPSQTIRDESLRALHLRYQASVRDRRPLARIVSSAVVVIGVAIAVVLVLQSDEAEAWSPIPVTPVDPVLVEAASSECGEIPVDQKTPVLVDQREDVAVAMFRSSAGDGPTTSGTCTLFVEDGVWRQARVDDLPFNVLVKSGSFDEELIESTVARVVIETDGQTVEVSHRDGFYLIWWPEGLALADESMRFLSEDGSTLLELPINPSRNE